MLKVAKVCNKDISSNELIQRMMEEMDANGMAVGRDGKLNHPVLPEG